MADDGQKKEIDPIRKGFGLRLQAARNGAKRRDGGIGYKQEEVAALFGVKKATVSAWETGRGAPDAFVLRALAKLYGVSSDALLWEDSLSPDAMKIAVEFDHLPQGARDTWKVLWLGFIARGAESGEQLPPAPALGLIPKEEDIGDQLPETDLGEKFLQLPRGKRREDR